MEKAKCTWSDTVNVCGAKLKKHWHFIPLGSLLLFYFFIKPIFIYNKQLASGGKSLEAYGQLMQIIGSAFAPIAAFVAYMAFKSQKRQLKMDQQLRKHEAVAKHFEQLTKLPAVVKLRDELVNMLNQDGFIGFLDFSSKEDLDIALECAEEQRKQLFQKERECAIAWFREKEGEGRVPTKQVFSHSEKGVGSQGVEKYAEFYKREDYEDEKKYADDMVQRTKELLGLINFPSYSDAKNNGPKLECDIKELHLIKNDSYMTRSQRWLDELKKHFSKELEFIKNKEENGEIYTDIIEKDLKSFLCQNITVQSLTIENKGSEELRKKLYFGKIAYLAEYLHCINKPDSAAIEKGVIRNPIYELMRDFRNFRAKGTCKWSGHRRSENIKIMHQIFKHYWHYKGKRDWESVEQHDKKISAEYNVCNTGEGDGVAKKEGGEGS